MLKTWSKQSSSASIWFHSIAAPYENELGGKGITVLCLTIAQQSHKSTSKYGQSKRWMQRHSSSEKREGMLFLDSFLSTSICSSIFFLFWIHETFCALWFFSGECFSRVNYLWCVVTVQRREIQLETAYRAYANTASKKSFTPLPINSFGKEFVDGQSLHGPCEHKLLFLLATPIVLLLFLSHKVHFRMVLLLSGESLDCFMQFVKETENK